MDIKSRRFIPLILVLGYLSILISCLIIGWSKTWSFLQIPTMYPKFADMRTVQGSLYSVSLGLNPQISNPGDPWGRVMNYPSVWIDIADFLNLQSESNYIIFIFLQIVLFLGCLITLTRITPSFFLILLCFSTSTLLCIERGNNDLLVFSFVFLALRFQNLTAILLISIATLVKIYPMFAMTAFIKNHKVFFPILMGSLLSILLVMPEFTRIRNGTPIGYTLSYGSSSVSEVFAQNLQVKLPSIVISICLIIISLVLYLLKFTNELLKVSNIKRLDKEMFFAGGSIYVFTFILASNYDYRLIFLLLCVPMILKFSSSILKFILIFCLLLAFNAGPISQLIGTLGSILNLIAKLLLFVLIFAKIFQDTEKFFRGLVSRNIAITKNK